MARHSRRHRSRSRRMSGGSYHSGASYGEFVNGSANAQFDRTLGVQGQYGQVQGNVIIGAQGQNVQPASMMPTSAQLNLASGGQGGGRRRRRRGGFLGEVVNQAIVPFALVGMQNTYRRKRGGRSRRTRRHHRR
jgi:hypothetical protein